MANNYNDGNWHPWTGGDCPVQNSTVDVMFHDGRTITDTDSDEWDWSLYTCTTIVAFKVTKEFKAEPREFWINSRYEVWWSKPDSMDGYIHVREVL
jgi:hypothetical protein